MRLSDRATGLFTFALGATAAYAGSRLPPVPGQQVGPNAFPFVIGVGLCLCGLMIAFGVGQRFEEEAEADLAAHSDLSRDADLEPTHGGHLRGLRVLVPPALLVLYVVAVDMLGFYLTAAGIILIAALSFGARPRLALPLAALAPIVAHLVFYKLLRVPLPAGLVPMPW